MKLVEIWKPIKDYEELYEVSNLGRIKALARKKNCNKGYGIIKEHIMKPTNCGTEYYRVPLTNKEHIKKYYLVHRLVAQAFIENPNNYPCVNHLDCNSLNNKANNLEWCDYKYNANYGNRKFKIKCSKLLHYAKKEYSNNNELINLIEKICELSKNFKIKCVTFIGSIEQIYLSGFEAINFLIYLLYGAYKYRVSTNPFLFFILKKRKEKSFLFFC